MPLKASCPNPFCDARKNNFQMVWATCGLTRSRPRQKRASQTKIWHELPRASPSIPPPPRKGIGTVRCLNSTFLHPRQRQPCLEKIGGMQHREGLGVGRPTAKRGGPIRRGHRDSRRRVRRPSGFLTAQSVRFEGERHEVDGAFEIITSSSRT